MGDWWIDETPYPGPPDRSEYDLNFKVIKDIMKVYKQDNFIITVPQLVYLKQAFLQIGLAVEECTAAIRTYMPEFQKPVEREKPKPIIHNTGPRPGYVFGRNGKRQF